MEPQQAHNEGRAQLDNRELTQVERGTVMGNLMRRYWIPAALSSELKAGGDPVRLLILGERLVAFRSPSGEVGIMDHRCPHRNASLFFGRNEEGGLRCIYHGWKFSPSGECLELPNCTPEQAVRMKVRTRTYSTHESHGLVWVYMGEPAEKPELPELEILLADQGDVEIEFLQRECNFMQALEGDLDTSHFGFLHVGCVQEEDLHDSDMMRYVVGSRSPELQVADTSWGTSYCASKAAGEGRKYRRFANFMFPFWTQPPQGEFDTNISARAWVPMDDHHTMSVTLRWRARPPVYKKMKDGSDLPGLAPVRYRPNTTDWYGRWVPQQRLANDYQIDRDAQREGRIFSGILNIAMQDHAVTESMGSVTDRAIENLAPSDLMIVRTRRRLLRAARELRDAGVVPPGVTDPLLYRDVRGGEAVTGEHGDWQEIYRNTLAAATRLLPADASTSTGTDGP